MGQVLLSNGALLRVLSLSETKYVGYVTAKVTKTEHVLDEQMKKFSVSFKNTCHLKVYLGKFSEGFNEEI